MKHLSSRAYSTNIAVQRDSGNTLTMTSEGERGEEVHVYAEQGAEVAIHQTERKKKDEKPTSKKPVSTQVHVRSVLLTGKPIMRFLCSTRKEPYF